jgi:hypothetical protein
LRRGEEERKEEVVKGRGKRKEAAELAGNWPVAARLLKYTRSDHYGVVYCDGNTITGSTRVKRGR